MRLNELWNPTVVVKYEKKKNDCYPKDYQLSRINIKQNRLCCKTTEKVPLSLGGFMSRKLPVNWVFESLLVLNMLRCGDEFVSDLILKF